MEQIRLGSRGSALAMRQAHIVKEALEQARGVRVEIQVIQTSGDRAQDPEAPLPGKAVWVKEIEEQLLDRRIDLAVHSMKDVPAELPPGLAIVAVPRREDPRDVVLTRDGGSLADLPARAVVGTSSLRRRALLLAARPDLDIRPLRGNIDTRVRRLLERRYDAVVLARAGLNRLGAPDVSIAPVEPEVLLPAPGQGALALEGRGDDEGVSKIASALDDPETALCVTAERAFSRTLGGSCRVPVAALARYEDSWLSIDGLVASLDGKRILRSTLTGAAEDADGLGTRLARSLLALGADEILAELEG